MAVITIRAGASYDVATPDEVRAQLEADRRLAQQQERERARGVKVDGQLFMPFSLTDTATTLFLADGVPESGFLWNVKIIAVRFGTADTVKAFVGTSKADNLRLVSVFGSSATDQVTTFSSSQCILKPGQGIVLVTAAHAPTSVFMTYAQAPAEMAYRIFD